MLIRRFLLHCCTGPDNATFDISRVLFGLTWCIWALAALEFLALAWVQRGSFVANDYATALGAMFGTASALLVTGGAGIAIKRGAEPPGGGS